MGEAEEKQPNGGGKTHRRARNPFSRDRARLTWNFPLRVLRRRIICFNGGMLRKEKLSQ
jgi:hypothetical protein